MTEPVLPTEPSATEPSLPPPNVPSPKPKGGMGRAIRDYFLGEDATFGIALAPMCFLAMALFTRHPTRTNFIFDEQEALLANPYVRSITDPNSKLVWLDAFKRDFWGLAPDRTIGSYRPIPNLIWRALWGLGAREQTPFLHHWVNVLLHGVNGALMTVLVMRLTKDRKMAWLSGVFFTASAVLTEAVSGVVGISDVLGGMGVILALLSLALPLWGMPFALFASALLGLFSKESAMCVVPLAPLGALLLSQYFHPERPHRWVRTVVSFAAALAAFVLYVEIRRWLFPVAVPSELSDEAIAQKTPLGQLFAKLLRWYAQPGLPRDTLNNPLIAATPELRVAGALRVYARGMGQVLFPWTLSGDYSAPQEPIPERTVFPESIIGALGFVVPVLLVPVFGIAAYVRAWREKKERIAAPVVVASPYRDNLEFAPAAAPRSRDLRPLVAFGLAFMALSYFPVSNIPVLLPTVRAERFWYFPVIGTAIVLGLVAAKLLSLRDKRLAMVGTIVVTSCIGFQAFAARRHAFDYTDDLVFWDATRKAVPNSSKAHLNYSVMLGARGDLEGRRVSNERALALAPKWAMAHVYLADTLCRMERPKDALPYYLSGFELGPNDLNLISLGLQCLWDKGLIFDETIPEPTDDPVDQVIAKDPKDSAWEVLVELADKHPGTWLRYLVDDTRWYGKTYNGVNPKYRPRAYNEGPKGE